MKKRTKRKIIAGAIGSLALIFAANCYFSKEEKDNNKPKEIVEQVYDWATQENQEDEAKTIADKTYDLITNDISENELSENEIITQSIINSGNFENPNEDAENFVLQMEKQCEEYSDNYELEKSKEGLENIDKMIYNFIYGEEKFHGIYFRDLCFETQKNIFESAKYIRQMRISHTTEKKEKFIEDFNGITHNIKVLTKYFNHIE